MHPKDREREGREVVGGQEEAKICPPAPEKTARWSCGLQRGRTLVFEDESQTVSSIGSAEGERIVVSGALKDLAEGFKVDSQSQRAIASVLLKSVRRDQQSDQRDVGGVQRLQGNTSSSAVEVDLCNQAINDR